MPDKVLVKFAKVEENTTYGLIIPESAKGEMESRTVIGEVMDINSEEKVDFEIGDMVIFKMFIADEIEEDGIKYGVLDIEDIMAVLQ